MRFIHLLLTLRALSFMRSTRVHFAAAILSLVPFILSLLSEIPNSTFKRMNNYMIFTAILFIVNGSMLFGPWSYIKVERNEEFLIMSGVTICGGRSKDQYGNVRSASSKDTCSVKISYPKELEG